MLLPADIGPYDPIGGGIKNSLVDDELGDKLAAIRAKGAFVWAIIDACHSGTVTRGDEVTRSVDPAFLAFRRRTTRRASRGGDRKPGRSTVKGDALVGFYAVDAFDRGDRAPLHRL